MQKQNLREIAMERIGILLDLAAEALRNGEEKYARRYVFLARKLSTRYNCRLPPAIRAKFCKGCGLPLLPGKNCRVRLRKRQRKAEYLCLCGRRRLFKYSCAKTLSR
ncbi:MAG: RNAase P [Candidatus Micrarchaeota archaeon]|nr:RNAase P [Candidatus Micrarchaeota archaeon]